MQSAEPPVGQIGLALLSEYLLPFELISVHLLVVLIGAAYLARARRVSVARTAVSGETGSPGNDSSQSGPRAEATTEQA